MFAETIMKTKHESVMLSEAIAGLNIQANGIYLDATYGRGGHARAILKHLNSSGKLLVMDKDPLAILDAQHLAQTDKRVQVFAGSFKELSNFCTQQNVMGKINGILFDLGVSSPQLDEAQRGFSFMREGFLDMRMDQTQGMSVAQCLRTGEAEVSAWVLKNYGEERFSSRIANAIVATRNTAPITTTTQLAELISATIPFKEKNKHPATRSFQALRIFINGELEDLSAALDQVLPVLAVHGRLVAISFHSLEDRIVKQYIATHAKGDTLPHLLPVKQAEISAPNLRKIGKALKPTEAEIKINVRARSAILRVAEKLSGGQHV